MKIKFGVVLLLISTCSLAAYETQTKHYGDLEVVTGENYFLLKAPSVSNYKNSVFFRCMRIDIGEGHIMNGLHIVTTDGLKDIPKSEVESAIYSFSHSTPYFYQGEKFSTFANNEATKAMSDFYSKCETLAKK